jgi:hypothetical protein
MKRPLYFFSLLLIFSSLACGKYDSENDCKHVPLLKTCDVWDDKPTQFTLDVTINTSDTLPIQMDIYNRTLVSGITSLYTSILVTDHVSSYLFSSGRYTAEIMFSNGSVVQEEFRLYESSTEYCEGICYKIHDAQIEITGP